MSLAKWNFPDNNYTSEQGLDTSNMEMFKQNPVSSLAREICQNSIDASAGDEPVKIDFQLFTIKHSDIPGITALSHQINECLKYKKTSTKEGPVLKKMHDAINEPEISCLRISDFNTTGLLGAGTDTPGTPFYNLTKGSGVSDKNGNMGGSKGIGKYASFVVSQVNTVFYSTQAKDGSSAYTGISQLRSAPVNAKDKPGLLTIGIGYYGIGEQNAPVSGELHLDKNFSRKSDEYGTDVYIIGFKNTKNWQKEITAKILESFMAAIIYQKLEVTVGDITVNDKTIDQIISDTDFQHSCRKTELKEIQAQYELLTESDASVIKEDIQIDSNNTVTLYVKKYTQQNADMAIRECIMVRDPYMKIKTLNIGGSAPYSAMCIIPDNELNRRLREIENPKHTNWEIRRLDGFPKEKKRTSLLQKQMNEALTEHVRKILRMSSDDTTDLEGAGKFLSIDSTGNTLSKEKATLTMKIGSVRKIKAGRPKMSVHDSNGQIDHPLNGQPDPNGAVGHTTVPRGVNPVPAHSTGRGIKPGLTSSTELHEPRNFRYENIVRNKNKGQYRCTFTAGEDDDYCEMSVKMVNDINEKRKIQIRSASMNGQKLDISNGKIVNFEIRKDTQYNIDYSVDKTGLFASEVKINAC